jgi:predicted Zn-dependent peptidase
MPEFLSHTLPNGLRVVAETDNRGYSASFGYFVRAGARDENDRQSGLSHFLEHMMFKGTARRSAADVNRELDELGGQSNAYTTEEQTVYYTTVLPKFQHRCVDLLSDMLSPALDEGEFNTEKNVILEEIAKYEDQPPFGAFERSMEIYFGPRGLGRRILGTNQSITAMTAEDLRDYFNTRYRPENIVLAATGNVDFEALIKQVSQATASWGDRHGSKAVEVDDVNRLPEGISLDPHLTVPELNQAYLVRIGRGPSFMDEDRHAVRALAAVLGDEDGSRLFWDLIDNGRAEVATVWPQEFLDAGNWFHYLVCDPEDLEANLKLMDQTMDSVLQDGIQADELNQQINKATAAAIMQSERPSNRLFGLGGRYLTRNEYQSLDQSIEKLKSLTVGQVHEAAKKYLTQPMIEVKVT